VSARLAPDEAILHLLVDAEAEGESSASLADAIGMPPRSVRRRLRRLIRDGYVFSPERGWYRITAAGAAAIAPLPARGRDHG
jgi:DNA-binding IclR family transcriptional regulator